VHGLLGKQAEGQGRDDRAVHGRCLHSRVPLCLTSRATGLSESEGRGKPGPECRVDVPTAATRLHITRVGGRDKGLTAWDSRVHSPYCEQGVSHRQEAGNHSNLLAPLPARLRSACRPAAKGGAGPTALVPSCDTYVPRQPRYTGPPPRTSRPRSHNGQPKTPGLPRRRADQAQAAVTRGRLLLRCVAAMAELQYVPVAGASRHGPAPDDWRRSPGSSSGILRKTP
jgi:hypothetical protein